MIAIGLFFEDASKQSKAQRIITNVFHVYFTLVFINYIFLDWTWFNIITPFGLGFFIISFLIIGFRKGKNENKPDA